MTEWVRHALTRETLSHPQAVRLAMDGTTMYVGKATVGTQDSDPHWQMFKLVTQPDGSMQTYWADGNDFFDNVWDSWVALDYR